MEQIKVAIFIAVFALFLFAARRLFSSEQPYDIPGAPPPLEPDPPPGSFPSVTQERRPAITGAELPFPIHLPPVREFENGAYNRPNILNYFFKKTDLVRGPDDLTSFADRFFIQFQSPDRKFQWTSEYTVATPSGLQAVLESEHRESFLVDGRIIIVRRFNLGEILQTIMDDVMAENEAPSEIGTIYDDPSEIP